MSFDVYAIPGLSRDVRRLIHSGIGSAALGCAIGGAYTMWSIHEEKGHAHWPGSWFKRAHVACGYLAVGMMVLQTLGGVFLCVPQGRGGLTGLRTAGSWWAHRVAHTCYSPFRAAGVFPCMHLVSLFPCST